MEHHKRIAALSFLLGTGCTLQANVSLLLSFRLDYFLALSEHFLQKELSQIFAPISGGGHATFSLEGQSTLLMELLSSMIRPSTPTALAQ
jgi:hypothetical protein